jgi:hypothetical protein
MSNINREKSTQAIMYQYYVLQADYYSQVYFGYTITVQILLTAVYAALMLTNGKIMEQLLFILFK